MQPAIGYQRAIAQITAPPPPSPPRQAARAAKRSHHTRQPNPTHPASRWSAAALTRRALIVLGTHNP